MARIDALFDELLAQKGSDLHLAVGYPPMVRARGDLVRLGDIPLTVERMQDLLFEILTSEQRRTIETEHDLDFAHAYGKKARFRASYLYRAAGLGAVFRVIPTRILSLGDLSCPDAVRKLAERRAGFVLVTGPTGSGKSTTLAAMIHHINQTRAAHVLTIEDPVEFVHEPIRCQITHREVGRDVASFPDAIRSAGREDPNVVLVGELRTNETMKLALQLASFGVLIMATVHTNSAAATIDRIINSFSADEQPQIRGMLSESLAGIVAQQLLKTADGTGRVAAHEILIGTSAITALIREGKIFQIPSAMQSGQGVGMQTMDMALTRLVESGRITPQAAFERASDKEAFQKMIVAAGQAPLSP